MRCSILPLRPILQLSFLSASTGAFLESTLSPGGLPRPMTGLGKSSSGTWVCATGSVGLDLSAGYYDIEPHHKGWQGEFAIAALEYGYAWRLSDAWRLDAFIDFGWIGTSFRYYEATEGDEHLLFKEAKNRSWILPTKLGVSFKYIIGRKPKNERRVKK